MRTFLATLTSLAAGASGSAAPLVRVAAKAAPDRTIEIIPFTAPEGEGRTDIAVIVCPGGSYFWHDLNSEGQIAARRLQEAGISAYVLKYRVAGIPAFITHYRLFGGGNRHPAPLADAQTAIRWVRENADSLGIDPSKVGILGFSAGGHLAVHAAVTGQGFVGDVGVEELRPAFAGSIYPVVTLSDEASVHRRSRRALLGDDKASDKTMRDSLSLEKQVFEGMPPVFLANCKDDPTVKYHNSEMLDSALTAANVPHRYTLYSTGGHGFGANLKKGSAESRGWFDDFVAWLKDMFKHQ